MAIFMVELLVFGMRSWSDRDRKMPLDPAIDNRDDGDSCEGILHNRRSRTRATSR